VQQSEKYKWFVILPETIFEMLHCHKRDANLINHNPLGDHFKCKDKQAHLERCNVVFNLNVPVVILSLVGTGGFGGLSPPNKALSPPN